MLTVDACCQVIALAQPEVSQRLSLRPSDVLANVAQARVAKLV